MSQRSLVPYADVPTLSGSLPRLLQDALGLEGRLSTAASPAFSALRELASRLAAQRLQLAVLGQFKRGKSTLLNALLGAEVLPMGVLPVTAIPTFLEAGGAPGLTERYLDGRVLEACFDTLGQLRERLASLVTEEANPNNRLGLSQVTVRAPSRLLEQGVVLIDTPGVGSTYAHNTEAADAVLPACDAALFVVSADPPITAVEIDYLARIQMNASHVLVALNKVDLLQPEDAAAAERFLRRMLVDQGGLTDPQIFAVSARGGLAAKLSGDARGLEKSGLSSLEHRLVDFIARDTPAVLETAVARKAAGLVAALVFQAELELKSLRLPLADLEQRRGVFEQAIVGFETERRIVGDLLAADLKRALQRLDDEAARLRARLGRELEQAIDQAVADGADVASAWRALQPGLPDRFEAELNAAVAGLSGQLEAIFEAHQDRADRLIDLVRRTAAQIMDLSLPAAKSAGAFEAKAIPYWVVERPEALNPLPPGAFDAVLPRALRERRARGRARREIAEIAMRNVENLRWALRQNVQDAFRRFAAEVESRFAESLDATRGVMAAAAEQRSGYSANVEAKLDALEATLARLRNLEASLAERGGTSAAEGGSNQAAATGRRS